VTLEALVRDAAAVLREHPGQTPEARIAQAVRLQQRHPAETLERCAHALLVAGAAAWRYPV
jgi:hypothetical protein